MAVNLKVVRWSITVVMAVTVEEVAIVEGTVATEDEAPVEEEEVIITPVCRWQHPGLPMLPVSCRWDKCDQIKDRIAVDTIRLAWAVDTMSTIGTKMLRKCVQLFE